MKNTINWGIIGLGRIARKFADDLQRVPGARLHAVAATDMDRALAFAADYGVAHAYGRYEDLLHCPDLDVVYVATPHTGHTAHTLLCVEHGLAVLCEKPFAMNAAEAQRMVDAARQHKVFLMEALWTRFIPATRHALALIAEGAIGKVHSVRADFGFHLPFDPSSRLYNKSLGGGSLLDIGIYPALLALFILGKPQPEDIQAAATFAETKVDDSCAFTFNYPGGGLAIGHSTVRGHTGIEAWIHGSKGHIYIHPRFHHSMKLTLSTYNGPDETKQDFDFPYEGWGYQFEAMHVMECLLAGKTESDLVPLSFSLDLMETLDNVRRKIGLEY